MNKKDEIPGRPKGTFASRLRQQASLQVILLLGLLFWLSSHTCPWWA